MMSEKRPSGADREDACFVAADPELVAEGWVRRFLADEVRAREAFELYTALGYEVKAHKPIQDDFGDKCRECGSVACRDYVMIYTRKLNQL